MSLTKHGKSDNVMEYDKGNEWDRLWSEKNEWDELWSVVCKMKCDAWSW